MQTTGRSACVESETGVREGAHRPVTGLGTPAGLGDGSPGGRCGAEAFVLRLCLDLQIDAMLLTLGAAAAEADPARGRPQAPGRTAAEAGPAPTRTSGASVAVLEEVVKAAHVTPADVTAGGHWRSWLDEDVEFVGRLAASVVAGGIRLPATLGQSAPAAVVDDLAARYEAMWSLLDDLAARGSSGSPGRSASGRSDAGWSGVGWSDAGWSGAGWSDAGWSGSGGPGAGRSEGTGAAAARAHVRRRLAWLRGERPVRPEPAPAALDVREVVLPAELLC